MLLRYTRLIFKREHVNSLAWLLILAGLMIVFAPLYQNLFGNAEDLAAMLVIADSPAMVALMGPVYGTTVTPAMAMAQQLLLLMIVAAAIMNIFFIVRHTRADEELGRMEVLRSLPIGRLTSSAATFTSAVVLNLAISLLSFLGLLAVGIDGLTTAGAFSYAFALGTAGIFFAALALLMCQMFSSSRGATTGALALTGFFYMLRGMGDVQGNVLSWISPMGIPLQTFAFYENNLLPLAIMLGLSIAVFAGALVICKRRDLGEGIIPARRGRAKASQLMLSPLGFAWRLSRGSFIGWTIAMLAFGAMYGAVLEMPEFLEIELMQEMLEAAGGMMVGFISVLFLIMAMLSAVPAMICVKRLYKEEKHHRLEQLYARAVPRGKMMLSFMGIAGLFSVIMPLMSALGMYAASTGADLNLSLGDFITGGLNHVPAIWVMLGLCVLLIGLWPKRSALVWVVFGLSFFVNYMGPLAFPPAVADIAPRFTPFGWIPQMPVEAFSAMPLIVLAVLAALLCVIGLLGYKRRDIGL